MMLLLSDQFWATKMSVTVSSILSCFLWPYCKTKLNSACQPQAFRHTWLQMAGVPHPSDLVLLPEAQTTFPPVTMPYRSVPAVLAISFTWAFYHFLLSCSWVEVGAPWLGPLSSASTVFPQAIASTYPWKHTMGTSDGQLRSPCPMRLRLNYGKKQPKKFC